MAASGFDPTAKRPPWALSSVTKERNMHQFHQNADIEGLDGFDVHPLDIITAIIIGIGLACALIAWWS